MQESKAYYWFNSYINSFYLAVHAFQNGHYEQNKYYNSIYTKQYKEYFKFYKFDQYIKQRKETLQQIWKKTNENSKNYEYELEKQKMVEDFATIDKNKLIPTFLYKCKGVYANIYYNDLLFQDIPITIDAEHRLGLIYCKHIYVIATIHLMNNDIFISKNILYQKMVNDPNIEVKIEFETEDIALNILKFLTAYKMEQYDKNQHIDIKKNFEFITGKKYSDIQMNLSINPNFKKINLPDYEDQLSQDNCSEGNFSENSKDHLSENSEDYLSENSEDYYQKIKKIQKFLIRKELNLFL